MKNNLEIYFIVLCLIIFFCNKAWSANWIKVIPGVFIDKESSKFYDNKVDFWERRISKNTDNLFNSKKVAFILTHQIANCNDNLISTRGTYKYSKSGHKLSAYHNEAHIEDQFKPVVPGTISSSVFNFMCNEYKKNDKDMEIIDPDKLEYTDKEY